MVKGTTTNAYPPSISTLGEDMAGNSTPEPATVMGMFVVGAAGLVALWCIRKKKQDGGHLYLRNNRIDRNEDFYLPYLINS